MTIRVGSELTVVESNHGRDDQSLDHGPSVSHDNTNTSQETDKPIALGGPSNSNKGVREVIASTPIMAYETPTRRLRTPSKFVFLSDRKSVPTEMKNLQERTIKRRRDFLAQIHDMVRTQMSDGSVCHPSNIGYRPKKK